MNWGELRMNTSISNRNCTELFQKRLINDELIFISSERLDNGTKWKSDLGLPWKDSNASIIEPFIAPVTLRDDDKVVASVNANLADWLPGTYWTEVKLRMVDEKWGGGVARLMEEDLEEGVLDNLRFLSIEFPLYNGFLLIGLVNFWFINDYRNYENIGLYMLNFEISCGLFWIIPGGIIGYSRNCYICYFISSFIDILNSVEFTIWIYWDKLKSVT